MKSIKMIVVGDDCVWKKSIIIQYIEIYYIFTTNVDKSIREIEIEKN